MTERRFGRRLGVTALVALGAIVSFAVIGGTGLAGGLAKPFKAQYGPGQYQAHKVTICHKGKVTIRVSVNALPAHVRRHGDVVGPCTVASIKAAKLKKAKHMKAVKAAKAEKATKMEKQAARAEKQAAKAAKRAAKAVAKSQKSGAVTDTVSAETSTKVHGPPSSPGNGHGNGHGKNKG